MDQKRIAIKIAKSLVAKESKKIEALRRILKEHQNEKIDGQIVDVMTANAIITVYDAINSKMKRRFESKNIKQMATVAWGLIK